MIKKKILIIRFNSIGDIVLTSSVIRALDEEGYEVHYLSKIAYQSLLLNNHRVTKHFAFEDNLDVVIDLLKAENYYCVIDLHNNYRSAKVCRSLKVKYYNLTKKRVELFLLTKMGIGRRQQEHIVDRFMEVASPLLSDNKKSQVEFYIPEVTVSKVDKLALPAQYITLSVGAAFYTKQIPFDLLGDIVAGIDIPIVLLGGRDDMSKANSLKEIHVEGVINLCGKLTIEESAEVIRRSEVLLTADTGLKHIGATLDVNIVAIYGSTHPILGYTPYYNDDNKAIIIQNNDLKCRPCTKQGNNACPKGHFKCMKELNSATIIDKIHSFI